MATNYNIMGSLLQRGWDVLGNWSGWVREKTYEIPKEYFFPAPQKTKLVSSIVSNQPYTTLAGYRSVEKQAQTTGNIFQRWYQSSKQNAVNVVSDFKNWIMGNKIEDERRQTLVVLSETVQKSAQQAITGLANYFSTKWGFQNRSDSGERVSNTPVRAPDVIIYQNETQRPSPATQEVPNSFFGNLSDFFGSMFTTQPQGEYSLAFPQQAPIPVIVPTGVEQAQGGIGITPIVIFGGIAVVLFIILRRK